MNRLWLPLLLLSCSSDDEPRELSVPVLVSGVDSVVEVDEELSYEITEARFTLADLRFERGEHARLWRWSLLPVAHAHPGHDGHDHDHHVGGELLGTFEVDLRSGDAVLGDADFFEGHYTSARFELRPTLVLEGTRRTSTADRSFRFELQPDLTVEHLNTHAHVEAESTGRFTLGLALDRLLSAVDWDTDDTNGDDLLTEDEGDVEAALLGALAEADTWQLDFHD